MKTLIFYILIFSSLSLLSQSVKGLSYETTRSSSGLEEGGTSTNTIIVITCNSKSVQISNLVADSCSLYKKLKLNKFDTLTIKFNSYRPYMSSPPFGNTGEGKVAEPIFKKDGRQKEIIFMYHPSDFNLYSEEESLKIEYLLNGETHKILLPKHQIEVYDMP